MNIRYVLRKTKNVVKFAVIVGAFAIGALQPAPIEQQPESAKEVNSTAKNG